MGSETRSLTIKLGAPSPPGWDMVYSEDFAEAKTYKGTCTHEDCAFLVDPLKLITTDWVKYAAETLPQEVKDQFAERGVTPLRLRIYVGTAEVLWGLAKYPAIRIESWHHGSPAIILVIAAIIGLVIVVWAFLAWIFQKAEEVPWLLPVVAGGGLLLLGVLLLSALPKPPPKPPERRRE